MNILKTILTNNTKQALTERGITGTYTFDVTVTDGVAIAKTMIDGAEFTGRMPVTQMMSTEPFSYTVTI